MTRNQALSTIVYEVATNGEVTKYAMRAYIENRVSYSAFQEAIKSGMKKHKENESSK